MRRFLDDQKWKLGFRCGCCSRVDDLSTNDGLLADGGHDGGSGSDAVNVR